MAHCLRLLGLGIGLFLFVFIAGAHALDITSMKAAENFNYYYTGADLLGDDWTPNTGFSEDFVEVIGTQLAYTTPDPWVADNWLIWDLASSLEPTNGYTVELRYNVTPKSSGYFEFVIQGFAVTDEDLEAASYHNVGLSPSFVYDAKGGVSYADDTDFSVGFHTVRMAEPANGGPGDTHLWVDGVLVTDNFPYWAWNWIAKRVLYGSVSSNDGPGTVLLDYLSIDTTGGFAPFFMVGDANRNGTVDAEDAAILALNWLRTGDAEWTHGDFNGDHNVNDIDATLLAINMQVVVGSGAVPEPGIFILLAGILFFAVIYRRQGR